MGHMKPGELANYLGLGVSTIRLWSLGEFGQFLSPAARGGGGRNRTFTDVDCRVIAFIAESKLQGMRPWEIVETMKGMQADEWRDLPPMPAAPPGTKPIDVMPREAAETAIVAQRTALLREISTLTERAAALETELKAERVEKAALQEKYAGTLEQLGELRGRLASMERERLPARVVLTGVLVVVLIAVALVALVVLTRSG